MRPRGNVLAKKLHCTSTSRRLMTRMAMFCGVVVVASSSLLQTMYKPMIHDTDLVVLVGPSQKPMNDVQAPPRPLGQVGIKRSSSTLLTVPFYVYEELVWHNLTYGTQLLEHQLAKAPMKQSEDFWFMKASLIHPLRTFNPEEAKLFVVPTLMNFVSDAIALTWYDPEFKTCYNGLCNEELLRHTEEFLSNSPYYQRFHGRDHIMVLSNWYSTKRPDLFHDSHVISNLNLINFENDKINHPLRSSFPSTYVGIPCNVSSSSESTNDKTSDFVFVGSLHDDTPNKAKKKRFRTRRKVCEWILRSSRYLKTSIQVCGGNVEQCPALAQAKYGFHILGDTYGANRLMDTLLSGTVPVFTNWDEQRSILPDWIDWELLSVRVNASNQQEFLQGIQTILLLDQTTDYYPTKHQHVVNNIPLLDWRTGIAFDVYMFMFQREILPSTVPSKIINPYSFSALKI
jgi:Exostosin family